MSIKIFILDGNDGLSDYRGQVRKLDGCAVLGQIDFIQFGAVPVADMGGLRQSLVFKQGGRGEVFDDIDVKSDDRQVDADENRDQGEFGRPKMGKRASGRI